MSKIERKFMAHYIDSAKPSTTPATPVYVLLGEDLEELITEMNANVETKNNILGQTRTTLDSYQPQASVEPYYAQTGEPLFERLQEIADKRLVLDDLKTTAVEVRLWEKSGSEGNKYVAYRQDAIIEVVSYGGDTSGYQIPFNIHYTGERVKGIFDVTAKTFTADTDAGNVTV